MWKKLKENIQFEKSNSHKKNKTKQKNTLKPQTDDMVSMNKNRFKRVHQLLMVMKMMLNWC